MVRCALILLSAISAHAAIYYASPTGSASNPGSRFAPWSLAAALGTNRIVAGDTLLCYPGTYSGFFISSLSGAIGAPITVAPLNTGDRVTLRSTNNDATTLTINGAYTTFKGLEVYNSGTDRTDSARPNGIDIFGPGISVINCVVHDCGNGIGTWVGATNNLVYGCLLYYNGYQGEDRGHGHGIYAQNKAPSAKVLRDNISFAQYGFGAQCFGSSDSFVQNFTVDGNVFFNNGALAAVKSSTELLIAGGTGADAITVRSNILYKSFITTATVDFGSLDVTNNAIIVSDNTIAQMVWFKNWNELWFQRNRVYRPDTQNVIKLSSYQASVPGDYLFTDNSYFSQAGDGFQAALNASVDGTNYTFSQWKLLTGLDASSANSTAAPFGVVTLVRPNAYETGRANVAVLNWNLDDNVSVDLSAVCAVGRAYVVRNAQNFYGPVVKTFVYAGGAVSLPMTNLTAATPVGAFAPSTTPQFNTFVVLPGAAAKASKGIGVIKKP